jgi:hypothetical protein
MVESNSGVSLFITNIVKIDRIPREYLQIQIAELETNSNYLLKYSMVQDII